MKKLINFLSLVSVFSLGNLIITPLGLAQISGDGTLSTEITTPDQSQFTIVGGRQEGGNLFHSFREFSIPSGGEAFFNNANTIQNIFSRVTGGSLSNIEGVIRANHPANLFLLNPSGIVFGNNAQLKIGGSFIASTASEIHFADGKVFSARDLSPSPLLTTSIPIGLQFRGNSGSIVNRSVVNDTNSSGLAVPPSRTLALIGSGVFLEGGKITTLGGSIEIGSVASPAFVSLIPQTTTWTFSYDSVEAFQDIQLSREAGIGIGILEPTEGLGSISLRGRNILLMDKSQITRFNQGTDVGGTITLNASEMITVEGDSDVTATSNSGSAADIIIEAKQLVVRDDSSFIRTTAENEEGRGGNLIINATESVEVDAGGGFNQLSTQTFANGNAGDLTLKTGRLILRNGGQLSSSTSSAGNAGTITVEATESVEISGQGRSENKIIRSSLFAQTIGEASGNGGSIAINTGRLSIQDGGSISVSALDRSTGQAGNLNINASESVILSGLNSTVLATSQSTSAGNLTINTPLLTIQQGATLSASTQTGRAGNLTINAHEAVQLSNNGELSVKATQEGGTAGNLNLTTGQLNLSEGAQITVSSRQGLAGNIDINANSLSLNQGLITAETGRSQGEEGANITLTASDLITIANESTISATANGEANGGNITIKTPFLIVSPPTGANGSDITANANQGDGGRIIINAEGIFGIQGRKASDGNRTNDLDASSESGSAGEIFINREPDSNQGLELLPETIVDPKTLIAQNSCKSGLGSELVVSGRGGLPPTPSLNENLNSEATEIGLVEPAPMRNQEIGKKESIAITKTALSPNSLVATQGWVFNERGEVVLVSYDPTVTSVQRLRETEQGCTR